MPSLSTKLVTKDYSFAPDKLIGVTCYNGKIYFVVYNPNAGFWLISKDGLEAKIADPLPNELNEDTAPSIVHWTASPTGRYIYVVFEAAVEDGFKLYRSWIDVEGRCMHIDVIAGYSPSWYKGDVADRVFSKMLGSSVLFAVSGDKETDKAYIIDICNQKERDVGTPSGSGYFPFVSDKCLISLDDLDIIVGVHLAGSDFKIFKYAQAKYVGTGVSAGGSPRAGIGNGIFHPYKGLVYVTGTGGVVDTHNILAFFNHDGHLMTLTLDSLPDVPETTLDATPGTSLVGITNEYHILALIHIRGSDSDKDARYVLAYLAEIDIENKKVVNAWKLYQSKAHYFEATNNEKCDIIKGPVIDLDNKKIVYIWNRHNPSEDRSANNYVEYVEIDVSDIFDNIKYWNDMCPIKKGGKIRLPTKLTLEVKLL